MQKTSKIISEIEKYFTGLLSSTQVPHGIQRSLRNFLKEIAIFKVHVNTSGARQKVKNSRVQIGGGNHYIKGFLNIDLVLPADMICDVREGIPLKSNSIRFLFSEHFLEHIDYPKSTKRFIKECYRVLEKNGRIVVGVPDSRLAVKAYYNRDKKAINKFIKLWYSKRNCLGHFNTPIDFLNYHFRDQDDDKKYHPHLWAYDEEKLKSLLRDAGFRKIGVWNFDARIANPKRKFGSVYVRGTK